MNTARNFKYLCLKLQIVHQTSTQNISFTTCFKSGMKQTVTHLTTQISHCGCDSTFNCLPPGKNFWKTNHTILFKVPRHPLQSTTPPSSK